MLITSEGEFKHSFTTKDRWKDLDIYKDLLIVTYYAKNKVSVYKLSKYSDDRTEYLTTEFLNDLVFEIPLLEFNTKGTNIALTFSGNNTMQLFEIISAYSIDFIREIPLFKYKRNMNFLINSDTNDITYARYEEFLYIVLLNFENEKDKKLFWFNLNDTNYDTLYSVISLDPYYYDSNNKIFIESGKFISTIYIYLFYGGKQYQYIKFEPQNRIQITNNEVTELCLPKDSKSMDYYPKINITMLLYPYYNDYTPAQNKSIEIVLMCMNYGLKIESRASSNLVSYQNKEGKATISLLDYFDGFNCNFQVSTENVNSNIYSLSQDISYNYLLESVSSTQNVIFTVEYTNFILVFFSQLGKLQVYSLQDSAENIKKIDKEYDYNELFYNWSIDFIHYSYIEWSEDSFFILSWKNYIGKITETYLYKVFHIDNISEDSIDLTMVFQAYSSYKIKRAALSEYKNQELRQYSLVMISEKDTQSDNSLIFINFVWDTSFDWNIIKIKSANGNTYNYDSFIVNSLIFYIETEFIIVAINNFGLVVISWITQDVILQIPIYDSYFDIPPRNMDIYTLIPLGTFGVRVLLNNEGGFSFFWNHVDENKLEIFWDFYVLDRYENINREVATNLFVPLKAGYAQVIKIPISYDNLI